MTNNNDFQSQLRNIRSEQQFHDFVRQNQNNPLVQKMLQMTQGKNPNDIMGIANNLANSSQQSIADVRKQFGF